MSVVDKPAALAHARIVAGDDAGTTADIGPEGLTVGRDAACGLVLADRSVAPRHVHLSPLPSGALLLNDLDLQRGVRVDGEPVTCAVLRGGERIRVGETEIEVETTGARSADAAPAWVPPPAPATPSMLERLRLHRSVRRATILGAAALVAIAGVGIAAIAGVFGGPTQDAKIAEATARAEPSTVLVQSQWGDQRTGSGTGWVLDAGQGLIVTNAHVLNVGERFTVGIGTSLRRASVVAVSPCDDLALLRVADTTGLRTLPLGSQRDLELGQTVVAIGFPGNASLSDSLTSTVGVVSVVRSEYREPALDVPHLQNVIQTDAALNPGNSGGPLLTLDGRIVGVSSAGRTLNAAGRIIQGQSYAIGIDRVREVLPGLRRGVSQGWYGMGLRYLSANGLRERDLPSGILINGVVPGSPADRAGIQRGRLLLTTIGGRPVSNSLAGYCDAVGQIPAEAPVAMTAVDIRTGARRTLELR